MMTKFENFVNKNFMFLTSVKFVYLIFIHVLLFVITFVGVNALNRNDAACDYIDELEHVIALQGICVDDVCGGDGYTEWYK